MSHEITPPEDKLIFDFKIEVEPIDASKARAFRTLCKIAFGDRDASKTEVNEIMQHLPYVLRYKMDCWFTAWTPDDIQDYAEGNQCLGDGFEPTYDQAKQICHNLENYEHLYSEVNEAVRNELITLRNSGVNE